MKPVSRTTLFSFVLILLFACQVWAATYYVKSGGNDSLDGLSDSTAWATIARVQSTVTSGDSVYFRSQDTWTSSSASSPILAAAAGVTYDGSSYGTGTRAKLQSGTGFTGGNLNAMVEIDVSNVTFTGFEIDGNQKMAGGIYIGYRNSSNISGITVNNCIVHDQGNPTTSGSWMYGILVSGYNAVINSNITITNCTIYNTYHEGIAIYPSWVNRGIYPTVDTVLIRNCVSYNNGTDQNKAATNGVGIAINNDSRNITVEFCSIYGNDHGINIRTSPDAYPLYAPTGMVIRYNLIYNNTRAGISLWNPASRTTTGDFYGNIIYNNGIAKNPYYNSVNSDGYDIAIASANWGNSVLSFYNNTIYNATNDCTNFAEVFGVSRDSGTVSGTPTFNLKSNIIISITSSSSSTDHLPLYADYGSGTFNHSNNLFYRSSGASHAHVSIGNYDSATVYDRNGRASDVTVWEPTAQNADPRFTGGTLPTGFTGTYGMDMKPNTSYFLPAAASPALNNGTTLGSPYDGCINGAGLATPITRPQGAAYDIGAYEYVETTRPTAPTGL